MTKESPEWNKSMNQARELLFQGDIAKFETMMGPAIANAMTPEGKEKALRLDQLGQLYKIYVDGFPEARRKARGASTLKVGNNEISIVEATPEKIIVRSLGKNQTYEWDKLPFGIAAALSDLALSDTAPVDLAARAV